LGRSFCELSRQPIGSTINVIVAVKRLLSEFQNAVAGLFDSEAGRPHNSLHVCLPVFHDLPNSGSTARAESRSNRSAHHPCARSWLCLFRHLLPLGRQMAGRNHFLLIASAGDGHVPDIDARWRERALSANSNMRSAANGWNF
jgi:hypothetical protein